jgi:hypothetical protein
MADGDSLLLGNDNNAQSQTSLNRTGFGDDTPGLYGLHVQALDGHAVGGVSGVGFGLEGISTSGTGVHGSSTSDDGVVGQSATRNGVGGGSNSGTGVLGTSFQGVGVEGVSFGPGAGVIGAAQGLGTGPGIVGLSNTSFGVRGQSGAAVLLPPVGGGPEFQKCGVQGSSDDGTGVRGDSAKHVGVRGRSFTGDGVFGSCLDQPKGAKTKGHGIHGSAPGPSPDSQTGPFAGFFENDVKITGKLFVGNTLVAHPLVMNVPLTIAAGLVDLDGNGEAVVELPEGLAELHTNFRYQLTAVGGPAPNLHVARQIRGKSFKIGGGTGKLKVSWQIGGEPKDKPAAVKRASEAPFDEKLAQEHRRWSENFARRLKEIKSRMDQLFKS